MVPKIMLEKETIRYAGGIRDRSLGDQRDQIDHPHEDEIEVGIAGQRRGDRRQIEPTIQGCPEKCHVFIFEPYSPVFYS